MSPMKERYYRMLFLVLAVYDLALGVVFMFFADVAFGSLGVADALPAFRGYISLLGAFLFVIGVAYYLIYRGDLFRNRDLIVVGALYKLAYAATAFTYYFMGDVPHVVFVALFGVFDAIVLLLMAECLVCLGRMSAGGTEAAAS